jgi:hypothetical protein
MMLTLFQMLNSYGGVNRNCELIIAQISDIFLGNILNVLNFPERISKFPTITMTVIINTCNTNVLYKIFRYVYHLSL